MFSIFLDIYEHNSTENNAVLSFFPNIQVKKKNGQLETYRPFERNGAAKCKRMKTGFCATARTSGACCSSLLHSTKSNLLQICLYPALSCLTSWRLDQSPKVISCIKKKNPTHLEQSLYQVLKFLNLFFNELIRMYVWLFPMEGFIGMKHLPITYTQIDM
jgi:hypothetical protein